MRSANGIITWAPLSTPAWIRDPKGITCQLKILLTPECPVNLLGRDALLKLQLALVPDEEGNMSVVRKGELPGGYVLQGIGKPDTYYTLEIPNKPPYRTGAALITEGRVAVQSLEDVMPEDELHVTMWTRKESGPDEDYDNLLSKATPAVVTLTYLYSDSESNVGVRVKLPEPLQKLFRVWTVPHVSICKSANKPWQTIGRLVYEGEMATDWVATSVNTWYSDKTGLTKKALFWSTQVQEGVHMTSNQMQ